MSYLDRLKQLKGDENFTDSPQPVLTKPTKGAFVSSVGTPLGLYEKKQGDSANEGDFQKCTTGVLTTPAKGLEMRSWGWRITHLDGKTIEHYIVPIHKLAEVQAYYPGAVIEPIAERSDMVLLPADEYPGCPI